jgi:hypothetical protein
MEQNKEQNKENNLIFFDIKDIFNKDGYFDFLNEKAKKFEELIFYIEDKTIKEYIGNYDDYKNINI